MYLPYLFDVAECVISRDEHEYYGDTATLVFIEKMEALEILCLRAPESLIWHCPLPTTFDG